MPDLTIRKALWESLVQLAEKKKQKPETLAERALTDFIERDSDEELLQRSAKAARRAPFRINETEEVIRRHRKKENN